jgi:uncharacterized protein (TIGR02246 family)
MRLARIIAAAFFLCLLLFTLFAQGAPNQDAALSSLRESWVLAFKMGDAAKAASFFTPDATIMPPGFPSTNGRKAIEQFYSDAFVLLSLRDLEIHSKEQHQDGPNTLRDHGTYKSTWVPKDGSAPYSITGRYLIIAKRQPDGHWLISWEMHTIESKVPADQL